MAIRPAIIAGDMPHYRSHVGNDSVFFGTALRNTLCYNSDRTTPSCDKGREGKGREGKGREGKGREGNTIECSCCKAREEEESGARETGERD